MPKPTNTQDLTARILSMLPGWTPEEQFFALLNAASHVASRKIKRVRGDWLEIVNKFKLNISLGGVLEELPEEKAPF